MKQLAKLPTAKLQVLDVHTHLDFLLREYNFNLLQIIGKTTAHEKYPQGYFSFLCIAAVGENGDMTTYQHPIHHTYRVRCDV